MFKERLIRIKMICQYCHNKFSSKSSINNHQKKTKYCLQLQGKDVSSEFTCEFCLSVFTAKVGLQYHYKICKANNSVVVQNLCNLQEEVKSLKTKLSEALRREKDYIRREKELREDYAKLAAISAIKPTTTNNTTNNLNLRVFDKTQDDIKKIVDENYDRTYLIQGQMGVAKFTHKHVLTDEEDQTPIYVITDKNRGNGKYKLSDTEVVSDHNMSGLTKKVHPSIKDKAVFIMSVTPDPMNDEEMMAGYREVYEMDQNNAAFRNHLIHLIN